MTTTDRDDRRIELTCVSDVTGADAATRDDVSDRTQAVETASAALRRAITALHQADDAAWQRYAADLEHATLRFDSALGMAAATLRANRATSKPELEDTLAAAGRSWRARAEEIRVQTHLGQLDARDAGLQAVENLEHAGQQVTGVLTQLRDDAGSSLETLRHAAGQALEGLGGALSDLRPRART